MSGKIIEFFARRHFLTNFIMIVVFVGGIFAWQSTQKEEWPDITMDTVRVTVSYPGASAEDVEYFITKEIEEEVRGIDGVYRIESTSSVGQSNVNIELEPNYPRVDEAVTEIRGAVLDIPLPSEVIDEPRVRVFKSSKKAIIDIGIIFTDTHVLDVEKRRELQAYAFALENQLLALPQVHSINKKGYLQEEMLIKAYPERLRQYDIPFNTAMKEIKSNNVRKPAGTLEAKDEPKVTLDSELDNEEKLKDLIIQGGFDGKVIRLGEVADVYGGYERNKQVMIINGHEGIMFSVVKNSSSGILETRKAVMKLVEKFKRRNVGEKPVDLILLDDETIDLRNRLSIITTNGLIGFVLILISLFIFLNRQSGVWVAIGIPFTLCFTMIGAALLGHTINGTTLAAVIIVMGIIVDDAIVVAENITRLLHKGIARSQAIVQGAAYVMMPVVASITTTCIAFVPLLFFEGRFGKFVMYIPPIVFLVLIASLIESLFILPGHMELKLPFMGKGETTRAHWFDRFERLYGATLEKLFFFRYLILLFAFIGMGAAFWYASNHMKFVMFPNEETRDIVLTGTAPSGTGRYETARLTKQIEDIMDGYIGREVVGHRTRIARSRRGGAVEENKFWMLVEIVPKEKRVKSADQLIKEFQRKIDEGVKGFDEIKFQKSRWGQNSGTPIAIIVQENNDKIRHQVVERLIKIMEGHRALKSVEAEEGLRVTEYKIDINREKIKRLAISPEDIASTFRAALEGSVLYEYSNGNEDVRARFTIVDEAKDDIEKVLSLPVENQGNYLVPLKDIVTVTEVISPNSITRRDLRRTSFVDAGIHKNAGMTPLEIAEEFEENIFPEIVQEFPTITLSFGGEVEDTRESASDFMNAIFLAVFLIYSILAILFRSIWKPLVIMLAIPFSLVGIVIAFSLHGKFLFGFYSAVGALGLAGVVINDAIIMLTRLDDDYKPGASKEDRKKIIAQSAETRLRAVLLTTLTTVAGVLPTAYGFAGYDAMLAEMMLSLAWGLIFGTVITLLIVPCLYAVIKDLKP